MATGLLIAAIAVLSAAIGWSSWRARAERERREEIRIAVSTVFDDATSLLTATLVGLESQNRKAPSRDAALATDGARALSRLLEAAHALLEAPDRTLPSAEGTVRVAIAIARSRGAQVVLRGTNTALVSQGSVELTCQTLASLVQRAWVNATPSTPTHIGVELRHDELALTGRFKPTPEQAQALRVCGWDLTHADGDVARWTLRAIEGTDREAPLASGEMVATTSHDPAG